jgi:hypothetical protein
MAEALFWLSAGLLAWTVAGYPLLLVGAGLLLRRGVARGTALADVQVVVPVHDGAAELAAKLENCLALDYPAGRRRILVVSDGSTDDTVAIARGFAPRGVECLELRERLGKVAAQNRALPRIAAPIVLFTDVSIRVRPDALRRVVENFCDPTVGVVTCRDAVANEGAADAGESLYIRYDMLLRAWGNRSGTLIGATGGFYAVREELMRGGWEPAHPPDFEAALVAIRRGLRVVEDERVVATYAAAGDRAHELERKVRTITRGMRALSDHADLLNPRRHGLAAVKLLHHKLLRWLAPLWLAGLLVSNAWIVVRDPGRPAWAALLAAQVGLWLAGLAGLTPLGRTPLLRPLLRGPAFALLSTIALVRSWWNLLRGRDYTVWAPTRRG